MFIRRSVVIRKSGQLFALGLWLAIATVQADDAQSVFNTLFGDQIRQVKATPNHEDNLALATEMLTALESVDDKKLTVLICENVFALASPSPKGTKLAANAMRQLAAAVPDQLLPALQRIADLHKSAYFRARGSARATLGPIYAQAMASLGDAQFDAGQWEDAIASYRRATAPALKLETSRHADLISRISSTTTRIQLEKKIAKLQATLDANPNNQATAKTLALIHLTQMNDLSAASTAALQTGDAKLINRIKLASLASADLTESQSLDLGDWFRSLAATANTRSKTKLLARAYHHYQHFLENHKDKGLARTKAEITSRSVATALKRLGIDTSQIAMHLPRNLLKKDVGAPRTVKSTLEEMKSIEPKDGWEIGRAHV